MEERVLVQEGKRIISRAEYRVMVKNYRDNQRKTVAYQRKQRKKECNLAIFLLIHCLVCSSLDEYLNTVDMKTFMQEVPDDPFLKTEGKYVELHQGVKLGLSPEMFVTDFHGEEGVRIMFDHTAPSTYTLGVYDVPIYLEDEFGHSKEVVGTLAVRRSSMIPVISGAEDISIFPGDSVSYLSNVSATDAFGERMSITVDNSTVNLNKYGFYDIIYEAKDAVGHVSRETRILEVVDDRDEVQRFVEDTIDDIFTRILRDDMTMREKAYGIFEWCRTNIRYASSGPRGDDYSIAYAALRGGAGDCFSYFAVEYLMLERAGIPVIPLERVTGTSSTHKWVAVDVGEGWHHFDTCRTWTGDRVFLYTDAQAKRVTSNSDRIAGFSTKYYVYKELPEGIVLS